MGNFEHLYATLAAAKGVVCALRDSECVAFTAWLPCFPQQHFPAAPQHAPRLAPVMVVLYAQLSMRAYGEYFHRYRFVFAYVSKVPHGRVTLSRGKVCSSILPCLAFYFIRRTFDETEHHVYERHEKQHAE